MNPAEGIQSRSWPVIVTVSEARKSLVEQSSKSIRKGTSFLFSCPLNSSAHWVPSSHSLVELMPERKMPVAKETEYDRDDS